LVGFLKGKKRFCDCHYAILKNVYGGLNLAGSSLNTRPMVDGVKFIGTFVLKIGELRNAHITHSCILNCSLGLGREKA